MQLNNACRGIEPRLTDRSLRVFHSAFFASPLTPKSRLGVAHTPVHDHDHKALCDDFSFDHFLQMPNGN